MRDWPLFHVVTESEEKRLEALHLDVSDEHSVNMRFARKSIEHSRAFSVLKYKHMDAM